MADTENSPPLCLECKCPGTLRCARCLSGLYCSKECQKANWSLHKLLCKTFKDIQTRPDADEAGNRYVRAIYFHPQEEAPRFVWLLTKNPSNEDSNILEIEVQPEAFFSRYEGETFTYETKRIPIICDPVQTNAMFYAFRTDSITIGFERNKSVHKLTDKRSRFRFDCVGPLLCFGFDIVKSSVQEIPRGFVDLSPSHLQAIMDGLNTHHFQAAAPLPQDYKFLFGQVQGVRLNCMGDFIDGRPLFEPYTVRAYDQVFENNITPISHRVELPIVVTKIPGSFEYWQNRPSSHPTPEYNAAANSLHLGHDPRATNSSAEVRQTWTVIPSEWNDGTGSCMAFRKDLKPLLPDHLEALITFASFGFHEFFRNVDEETQEALGPGYILSHITKDRFRVFWGRWLHDKGKAGVISPYDV